MGQGVFPTQILKLKGESWMNEPVGLTNRAYMSAPEQSRARYEK